jgi:uncharacterized protein YjbI with pentapeptide repeats
MITAQPAPVRPRVTRQPGGEALPLDEEVGQLLACGRCGLLQVVGREGSGKTTALQHLAALLPPQDPVNLLDQPRPQDLPSDTRGQLTIFTTTQRLSDDIETVHLAPWGRDEWIEYLLGRHKSQCASVMTRLCDVHPGLFAGLPDIWRLVLDELAGDSNLLHPAAALHRYLESQLPDTDLVERARSACLNFLTKPDTGQQSPAEHLGKPGFQQGLVRLLRHSEVQLLLAAERMAADLSGPADCDFLALRLPRELVRACAANTLGVEQAAARLQEFLDGPSWSHAMAASILHVLDPAWMPRPRASCVLTGAYLDGVRWQGLHLEQARLDEAHFRQADLSGAQLAAVRAVRTNFRQAKLSGTCLKEGDFSEADLSGANLIGALADNICFYGASLQGARLEDAHLTRAQFVKAKLVGASLRNANLMQANFSVAAIDAADFSGADCSQADFTGLRLAKATFAGARCPMARLVQCDLEYMDWPNADFERADLTGALLTGSIMPAACFTGAILRGAGLADVQWEGASLRNADLRQVSFHLGSSRSGLVHSPIACEGSRTGFYTDDYEEQHFKSPEEIRKANLCGADLRGARIVDVDFYLVDLRGALVDPAQEEHLRRCGAILQHRAENS